MPNFVIGNLWDEIGKADLILATTNSPLDQNGHLVMGKGSALEMKQQFPDAPHRFGDAIGGYGPRYGCFMCALNPPDGSFWIGAFQTKQHWRDKAELELIAKGSDILRFMASEFNRIAMPFPGIGYGGLKRADVLPLLESLPNNVWVYEKERNT